MPQICALVETRHLPLPEEMSVKEEFGTETLTTDTGTVTGIVQVLEGTEEVFKEWLSKYDGIWNTLSPIEGAWEFVSTRKEGELDE